ncbi:acyltransferase [Bacillus manliponensis]|uniref:acyltransferase n=1 Tax=Bacillus manliponensis TaxID=574376 RepID=UPI00351865FD
MNRLVYIDWLRVWATIAVVTIHVAAGYVTTLDSNDVSRWMAGNFFESMTRACVPIFVMISGALLLRDSRELSNTEFLKKRVSKVFIPFIGWSALFYLYGAYMGYFPASIKQGIKHFLTNSIGGHLWFMYMIVGIYLITPLLKILVKHAKKTDLQYFLLLWAYASVGINLFHYYYPVNFNIELYFVTNYVGYFLLGYYLAEYEIVKKWRKFIYIGGVAGFIGTFVITYVYTVQANGQLDQFWYSYFAPNVVLMAIGLFVLFKYSFQNTELKMPLLLKWVGQASLGIYLLHFFLLNNFLYRVFPIVNEKVHAILAIPINTGIALGMSMVITLILQRIPLVKKLVP